MSVTEQGRALKAGALGLPGLTILGAAMMAPALGLYLNWGPMELGVGLPTPLVFLAAMIITLPIAISYSQISKRMTSSGAVFAWSWREIGPRTASWVGIIMNLYYLVAVVIQPVLFGMFFNDFLSILGVHGNMTTWALGTAAITVVGMVATYKGISISVKTAMGFMSVEILVVIALLLTILFTGADHGLGISAAPFKPSMITSPSAFWAAMIFGILSFAGFDVLQTAAEETKSPNSLIPKATLWTVIIVGVFWIVGSWILSISEPLHRVTGLMTSGFTPITGIAKDYWGAGKILVDVTGMTALGGALIACAVGSSRITFAQGRHGTLSAKFGETRGKNQVPVNALHLTWAATIAAIVVVSLWLKNPNSVFIWWAGSIAFFALITYFFVHVSSLLHHRRIGEFNWFLHGVIPVGGSILIVYLIWKTFFQALWGLSWASGKSVLVFGLVCCLAALIYVLVPSAKLRAAFEGSPPEVSELPHA